jgi:hypothetical protein
VGSPRSSKRFRRPREGWRPEAPRAGTCARCGAQRRSGDAQTNTSAQPAATAPAGASAADSANSARKLVYRVSGAAALVAAGSLSIGAIGVAFTSLQAGAIDGWFAQVGENWLVVLFKLHAGFGDVQSGRLYGLDALDIAIMAAIAVMHVGLYVALRKTSRVWSVLALCQPFLGIALFVATQSAGRSAVMGAGLVVSFVMLRSDTFGKLTAYLGILASACLLVGDFSEGIAHARIIAIAIAVGYVTLMAWLVLIAGRLFRLANQTGRIPSTAAPAGRPLGRGGDRDG